MPYIKQEERFNFDEETQTLRDVLPDQSVGALNYIVTTLVKAWVGRVSYERLNAAIGVLEAVKLELYRRMAAPYEDEKCAQNGDVY